MLRCSAWRCQLGALPETITGLSRFGDLTLSCSTKSSRNYSFDFSLGQGTEFDATISVEGAASKRATLQQGGNMRIDMPITVAVAALLDDKIDIAEAMDMLLSRPLK